MALLLFELDKTTLAMPLRVLYPECGVWIADSPLLHPLICLRDTCHKNNRCVERMVPRILALFAQFPMATLLILYFTYRHRQSVGGALFRRNFDPPPRLLKNPWGAETDDPVVNRTGWEAFKKRAVVTSFEPPPDFFDKVLDAPQIRTDHEAGQVIAAPRGQLVTP